MRITFILPFASLSGGIRVVAIHAERLQARGHAVTVVSTPKAEFGRVARVGSALRGLVGASQPREESYFDSLPLTHRVLPTYRPIRDADVPDGDVVIATWWRTAEWVAELSPSKGVKVHFVQGHEVFPEQPIELVRAAYKLPIAKVTISRWLVDVLRDEYGFSDVPLVPNAVDHETFQAPCRGRQARPTVGFLYNPGSVKGCDVVLRAIARIRSKFPDLHVVAIGHGRPTSELPLPGGSEFISSPTPTQLRETYSRLDLWICGSRSEGFHLMPLEAMACRTPVVATRVGGTVETVRPGVNGHLVAVEDDKGLAEKSIEILSLAEDEWKRYSDNAAAVAGDFSWDRSADLMEKAILAIVGAERGATKPMPK